MSMIILLILDIPFLWVVTEIVKWIAVVLTIVSLVDYVLKNKQVLTQGGM